MSAMPMPVEIENVASRLNLPPQNLMERSLRAFLRQEIRAVQMDIADLQDRYGVDTSKKLILYIKEDKIYSHPAWEDSIEWEELENHFKHLKNILNEF